MSEWFPIETAPDREYHLLADPSAPHLAGVFLGQVVDGVAWDCHAMRWVPGATLWMPVPVPSKPEPCQVCGRADDHQHTPAECVKAQKKLGAQEQYFLEVVCNALHADKPRTVYSEVTGERLGVKP